MDRQFYILLFILYLLQGCSGGSSTSTDSNAIEPPTPDRSTISQLKPLEISISNNIESTVAVHNSLYAELGIDASITDANGTIHLFYGGKELRHKYFDGVTWKEEIIDSSSKVGRNATVVLGKDGTFHILYQVLFSTNAFFRGENLKYAKGNTGSWTIETTPIYKEGLDEHRGTLALDLNGNLLFAHRVDYNIMLSKYSDGTWSQETIAEDVIRTSGSGLISNINLIVDKNNTPHVFYLNTWNENLIHTSKLSGFWQSTTLALVSDYHSVSSVRMNAEGYLQACFRVAVQKTIYCDKLIDGDWIREQIEFENIYAYLPTLKIDKDGSSHLAYYVTSNEGAWLRYATNKAGSWQYDSFKIASSWQTSIQDPINIEVEDNGDVNFFFKKRSYSSTGLPSELLHLKYQDDEWIPSTLEFILQERTYAGKASDIEVGPSGKVEIAYTYYHSGYPGKLNLASALNGENWVSTTPLPNFVPDTGLGEIIAPLMEFDALGNKHIVSSSTSIPRGIYYLSNKTNEWQSELIANTKTSDINKFDLVLGKDGSVHVLYLVDAKNIQARYVTNKSGEWIDELVYEFPNTLTDQFKSWQQAVHLKVNDDNSLQAVMSIPFRENDPLIGVLSANKTNNVWQVSSVLKPGDIPARLKPDAYGGVPFYTAWEHPELMIDKNSAIHFSYNAFECNLITCTPVGIGYSTNVGGTWEHKIVDSMFFYENDEIALSYAPEDPSMIVTDSGEVYLAYYHDAYEEIRLARIDKCANKYLTIDTQMSTYPAVNDETISASITESDQFIHVSYYDNPNGNLKYAKVAKEQLASDCRSDDVLWVQKTTEIGEREIIIKNQSTSAQQIENISMSGDDGVTVLFDECLGSTIEPKQSCKAKIQFSQLSDGFYPKSLNIDTINMENNKSTNLGINFEVEVY